MNDPSGGQQGLPGLVSSHSSATTMEVVHSSTTTTSSTMLTAEQFMTEGTTAGETDEGNMRRRGSWRKFKETVKETVQGWVGGKGDQSQVNNVPSAVFPSDEVTSATINVKHVLHNTNCYSGGKKPDASPDLPKIVVTCDPPPPLPGGAPPTAPERRHKQQQSTPIGVPQSQPVPVQQRQSNATPPNRGSPSVVAATPPKSSVPISIVRGEGTEAAVVSASSASSGVPGPGVSEGETTDLKKKMAVMKIRQAIFTMNPDDMSSIVANMASNVPRRNSDTPQNQGGAGGMVGSVPSGTPGLPASAIPPQLMAQNLTHRRKSTSEALPNAKPAAPTVKRASSMKKPKAKPMIWEHFEELPNTSLQGRCRACKMNLSCKFNTGNFVRHLQLAHKDIYRQYQNKMEDQWTRSMLERSLK